LQSAALSLGYYSPLFAGYHDPQQQVDQQAWHAAWNKGNDHRQAKPERADADSGASDANLAFDV
jgi:hypothetical protein